MENKLHNFKFIALDPIVETKELRPVERETVKGDMVNWGSKNNYPSWLYEVYRDTSTMTSIINCIVNYVVGDGADGVNTKLIHDMAETYCIFGGIPLHTVHNKGGELTKVECLDMRYVRTNKKHDLFWYNEDFTKSYQRQANSIILQPWTNEDVPGDRLLFYKNTKYSVYPVPEWSSAIKSCIIEQKIDDFHMNDLLLGFSGQHIFNFCDGVPDEEVKKEIETSIMEKFAGVENAGRPMINYADDKEHALQVDTISSIDFGDRYTALLDSATHKQYAVWRCNANLVGITEGNNSFNSIEFEGLYKLFEAQVIKPIRSVIEEMLSQVYKTTITIKPFVIKFDEETV